MERSEIVPTIDNASAVGDAAEPAAPPARAPASGAACHNCGATLNGRFCDRCGQEDVPLVRPLRDILREWVEDVASLDSRILRTVVTLCIHPGRLTVDYIEGRRIRCLPPIRLYIAVSVLFFFLAALSSGGMEVDMSGMGEGAAPPSATVSADSTAADVASETDVEGLDAWVVAQAFEVNANPGGFARFWIRVVAWSMFVLMPIVALFLMVLYRRSHRFYELHLVFTLHIHAFAFLLFALALGIGWLAPDSAAGLSDWIIDIAVVAAIVYTFVALLRVYGEGALRTTIKFCGLALAYSVAFIFVMGVSSLIAFGLF